MDFDLTADQEDLRDGVRRLLQGRAPMSAVRQLASSAGVERSLWRELAEAGVFSLRLPDDQGGAGLGMAEAALVFEELGRALVPGPLVATHVLAGALPGAAAGDRVVGREGGACEPERQGEERRARVHWSSGERGGGSF